MLEHARFKWNHLKERYMLQVFDFERTSLRQVISPNVKVLKLPGIIADGLPTGCHFQREKVDAQ